MPNGELFAELELSEEQNDAQRVLRMNKGSLGRARKVIEHWKDMAKEPRYEGGNWLTGDRINPLANREHDALWEAGDGDEVAAAVRHALRGDVNLSRLVVNNEDLKRYVSHRLLDVARQVIALEESHSFKQTLSKKIESIEDMRKDGLNVKTKVIDMNCLISEQKIQGFISEQEMQSSYAAVNEAAYPGQSLKEAETIAGNKGEYGLVGSDREYAGRVIGVTDAHVVISTGRGAVISGKGMLNRCPGMGEDVSIKFKNGVGVVSENREMDQSLGR